MEKQDGSTMYNNLFDAFASDVGSTLDDLATNWEQYDGRQSESDQNMEDLGKRLAKPLFFYNPVYSMVNNNKEVPVIRRPTLIPLSEVNKNSKDGTRDRSDSKSHDKKKHGLLSKIAGMGRRHSKDKLERYSTSSSDMKLTEESIVEDMSSFLPVKSSSRANTPTTERNNSLLTPDKPSRLATSSPSSHIDTPDVEVQKPVPVPRKNKPSPVLSPKQDHKDEKVLQTIEDLKNVDSGSSFSSTQSDEGNISDDTVTTMADVINEVSTTEQLIQNNDGQTDAPETESNESGLLNVDSDITNAPSSLKRNKTLKWSGSRRAPALIREFTRRQKSRHLNPDSGNLGSPNKEVESVLLSNTIMQESPRPRSCTPSQQTTSFGMEDTEQNVTKPVPSEGDSHKKEIPVGRLTPEPNHVDDVPKSPADHGGSKRDSAFIVLSSLLPPAPRLRRTQSSKVRAYLYKMGTNVNNALGYAVSQFVQQTVKSKETRPLVILHDIRSFLTDIKRYLISNPHIGVVKKIQKIINYSSTVDVEGAVDDSLDKLVLYPLHSVVYRCLVLDYTKTGQLKLLEQAIVLAKSKSNHDLGLRPTLIPPSEEHLEVIKGHFVELQKTYSPYFKLKELLQAVTVIYENTQDLNVDDHSAKKIGADDFLPLLVHSLVHCNFVAADIEAQYIDGLLDPTLLLGEGGYYLTTLISAVQVVLSMKRREAALPNISDLQGFLKVGISSVKRKANTSGNTSPKHEETISEDFILHKTLHVPPAMTAHSLCQMITRKFDIGSPKDFCLHVVVNEVAYALEPSECPQLVKMDLLTQFPASDFYFSFQKRSLEPVGKTRPISIIQQEGILVATTTVIKDETILEVPSESVEEKPLEITVAADETIEVVETEQTNYLESQEPKSVIKDVIEENNHVNENETVPEVEMQQENTDLGQASDKNGILPTDATSGLSNISEPETVEIQPENTETDVEQTSNNDEEVKESSSTENQPSVETQDPIHDITSELSTTTESQQIMPIISVTKISEEPGDNKEIVGTPLKRSSLSNSIDDVFSSHDMESGEMLRDRRETVASLTEYFESKSGNPSPKMSPCFIK
uniref:Ras and Rab interactor 2-like n=1 Tax=Phallusia mammillata TaxID=59560 RepID=A0A6F9DQ68_9ASCI|nr:ras and Rab interactor 2-like [Phallusia mammillata]